MELTDGRELVDPHAYARAGYPHALWTELRRESPVHWCEPPVLMPFWAVTRHALICEVSKRPELYRSGKGILPATRQAAARSARGERSPLDSMQTIITMDPPKHRVFRRVASPHLSPRAIANLDAVVQASARRLVDRLYDAQVAGEGACDF